MLLSSPGGGSARETGHIASRGGGNDRSVASRPVGAVAGNAIFFMRVAEFAGVVVYSLVSSRRSRKESHTPSCGRQSLTLLRPNL